MVGTIDHYADDVRPHSVMVVDDSPSTPLGRALRVLQLIQARPGITADELARRLDTTSRAIRRHVAALRDAGVPIDARPGRYGGYRLGRAIIPPPLLFTATEVLGLVMAVLDGHHAAADLDEPVGSALHKLIGALPPHAARQADTVRRHALAAPDRRAVRPDAGVASTVVDAAARQRRVRLAYTTGGGTTFAVEVDPWAVVVRHGKWYLLGYAHERAATRSYRVDRIREVTILGADARPPDDFDPVAWLEAHLGTGWRHQTRVRFDAPYDRVAPWIRPPMGQLEPIDGGDRCILTGSTDNPTMYAGEWLAAIPHPFHVLEGPELREAVGALAGRLTAAATCDPGDAALVT